MKKVIFAASLIAQAALLMASVPASAAPGNGNAYGYGGQGNGNHNGHATAPVPLAGAGLPALALIGGAYVVLRAVRKRRESSRKETS